jgi:hypothetical protein
VVTSLADSTFQVDLGGRSCLSSILAGISALTASVIGHVLMAFILDEYMYNKAEQGGKSAGHLFLVGRDRKLLRALLRDYN